MIHSAFIRHRKQRESEQRSVRERERERPERGAKWRVHLSGQTASGSEQLFKRSGWSVL